MNDRTRVALAMLLGASAGGVLGYLYLTEGGRVVRQRIEPMLDECVAEIERLRRNVRKAREAADEGLRAFDEFLGQAQVARLAAEDSRRRAAF